MQLPHTSGAGIYKTSNMGKLKKPCVGCGTLMETSNLWKHYAHWTRSINPRNPDDKHPAKIVDRMREIEDEKDKRRHQKADPKRVGK
jgi:hypothetical protein